MSDLLASGLVTEVHGDGDAVVMLHGLGGSSNTFETLMPALGGYRVIRPDLPGAGRSALPGAQLTIASINAAVLRMLNLAGVERAHFVGHSMGTLLCQHLAATAPERVRSLTLFGALTQPADANREGLRQRAKDVRESGMAATAEAVSNGSTSSYTHETNPAARAFVRESLLRQSPPAYAAHCEALAAASAVDPRALRCPVLIVTGRDDPVTPPSMAQSLADKVPGARLRILERCGHWAPFEFVTECRTELREFLSTSTRSTG